MSFAPGAPGSASSSDLKGKLISGSLLIDPSLTRDGELNIVARDHITKRLFEGSFTADELVDAGFNPMFTLPQMVAVVKGAVTGEPATTISTGYVMDESADQKDEGAGEIEAGPPAKQTHTTTKGRGTPTKKRAKKSKSNVIIDVKKAYFRGSALVILINHDLTFFKSTYTLILKEVIQDSVDILEQRLNDANTSISELKSDVKMGQENAKEVRQLRDKLKKAEDLVKSMQSRYDEMEKKMKEYQDKPLRPPQVGCWQSTSNKSSYKSWNTVVVAPPAGLFNLTESSSKISITKAGIYHVHGMGSCAAGAYIYMYVNGSAVTQRQANGSYNTSSCPFDLTRKFAVGDYIQIYSNSNYNSGALYNTLTIEKLD